MQITEQSLELFLRIAREAKHWGGNPWVEIIGFSAEERGNFTQLKQAGLLWTVGTESDAYVEFSDSGRALAAKHGVEIGG